MSKKCILLLSFLLTTLFCSADNVDSKYLNGAVPEIDGKVIFNREIKINESISPDQLYKIVSAWVDTAFASKEGSKQRILLNNPEQKTIVVQGDDKLIFKSSFLALDKADLLYRLTLQTEQGKCILKFSNLKYTYQDFKNVEKAENLITDKYAYNKNKNKLNRYYDKFRIFTIDQVDERVNELKKYLSNLTSEDFSEKQVETLQSQKAIQIVTSDNTLSIVDKNTPKTVSPNSDFQGYKLNSDPKSIVNYANMIEQSQSLVLSNNNTPLTVSWNGLDKIDGQDVATIICPVKSENVGDYYTIAFINNSIYKDELNDLENNKRNNFTTVKVGNVEAYSEAWMIIVCKKLMTTPINKDSKLTIGRIEQIWVR